MSRFLQFAFTVAFASAFLGLLALSLWVFRYKSIELPVAVILYPWTANIATALWTTDVAMMLLRHEWRAGSGWVWTIQLVWLFGSLMMIAHILVTLKFQHHWSLESAYRETERQSGVGEGVYVNLLFAVVWFLDAAWLVVAPMSYSRRSRWIRWGIHGFLGFIVFNAVIVFGPTPTAELGIVWCFLLLVAWRTGRLAKSVPEPLDYFDDAAQSED